MKPIPLVTHMAHIIKGEWILLCATPKTERSQFVTTHELFPLVTCRICRHHKNMFGDRFMVPQPADWKPTVKSMFKFAHQHQSTLYEWMLDRGKRLDITCQSEEALKKLQATIDETTRLLPPLTRRRALHTVRIVGDRVMIDQ